MRIGYGWDSHEFKRGLPLMIGGVRLPHSHGLTGHSDGDVLLHALTDALLGAVAAGDIGSYFPPSDKKWKGANSVIFLQEALRQVKRAGYAVSNVDSTLILAAPEKETLFAPTPAAHARAPGRALRLILPAALLIVPVPVNVTQDALVLTPVAEPLKVLAPTKLPRPVAVALPDALVPFTCPEAWPL